jgi:hypothetical protein
MSKTHTSNISGTLKPTSSEPNNTQVTGTKNNIRFTKSGVCYLVKR